jgi:hypothetical protein
MRRFPVITLCGSTKFKDTFLAVQKQLTLDGFNVLSLGLFGHSGDDEAWEKKEMLDNMHLDRIDMCDGIMVIDVNGYIGESTKNEISFATNMNKKIVYLSESKYKDILKEV